MHQIAVATYDLRHKITAALLCDTSRLIMEKPSDCVLVTGEQ
jgi:hypothetical protein